MADKPKLLTVKLDLQTLAEFSVAVKVFRGRSVASHVHNFIINQIRLAKHEVGDEKFAEMVGEQLQETLERSELRTRAAKKDPPGISLGSITLTDPEEGKKKKSG
jgi:hypothetical protein